MPELVTNSQSRPNDNKQDGASSISFAESDFVSLGLNITQTSVMPVVHVQGDTIRGIGTCFAITNSGVCMTARHVIEEAWPNAGPDRPQPAEEDGYLGVLYVSTEPNPDDPEQLTGGILPISKVYLNWHLDIALMHVPPLINTLTDKLLPMPVHRLGAALPEIGEVCFGLGYPKMDWSGPQDDLQLDQKYIATRGSIVEVHGPQRDSVMLPFPCFMTDARFDAGMSGGPVFTMDGLVRGVICSSMSDDESGGDYVSYASLIAPAFGIQLEASDASGAIALRPLYEFAMTGAVMLADEGMTFSMVGDKINVRLPGDLRSYAG